MFKLWALKWYIICQGCCLIWGQKPIISFRNSFVFYWFLQCSVSHISFSSLATCRSFCENRSQMYTHTSWQGDRIDITVNQIHPALTHPKATKCYKGESRKCTKFDYVIEGGLTYGHQIVARAVTPEWRAAGGQCFVVRQVPAPGLNSRETLLFWLLPFRGDSLEMKGGGSFKEVRVKVSWEVLQTGASSVPCDHARGRGGPWSGPRSALAWLAFIRLAQGLVGTIRLDFGALLQTRILQNNTFCLIYYSYQLNCMFWPLFSIQLPIITPPKKIDNSLSTKLNFNPRKWANYVFR